MVVENSRAGRRNALVARIGDVDPEFLFPYGFVRRGRTQDTMLEMVRTRLVAGQAAGTVRSGDPDVIARSIMLTALGFTLAMRTMTDRAKPADPRARADANPATNSTENVSTGPGTSFDAKGQNVKLKTSAIQNRGGKLVTVAPKGSTNAKVEWPMAAYDKRR
mgnify:CR=1 FL=1